jgi:hypothetical protein
MESITQICRGNVSAARELYEDMRCVKYIPEENYKLSNTNTQKSIGKETNYNNWRNKKCM